MNRTKTVDIYSGNKIYHKGISPITKKQAINRPDFKVILIVNSILGKTYGLNIIAAQLKKLGIEVSVLYLAEISVPSVYSQAVMAAKNAPGCTKFSEPVIEQVIDFCKGASLVGISLLTSGFFNAVQLTNRIKESIGNIPIIWGGKHPTINPTECLQYADAVCLGEGDIALTEYVRSLMRGKVKRNIQGLWFKDGDVKNPQFSYIEDLDGLPFPDYGPNRNYLLENEIIKESTEEDVEKYLLEEYPTMIARGCPMKCTFCTNSAEDNRRLRIRSVDNVIAELERVQKYYGNIKMVMFRDDTIMSLKLDYIKEFSSKWRERLNIPFSSSGVIPTAVKEAKLRLFLNAGFFSIKMGIQSGSTNVRKNIYWRPETNEQIIKAANTFKKLSIPRVGYMFITDNPWEKEDDIVTSLRFISRLKRPFSLSMYSLNIYPGTELFYRAVREGRIRDAYEWYNKSTMTLKKNYFNMLYMMQRYYAVPPLIITLLTTRVLYRSEIYKFIFTKFYGWYFRNLTEFGVERKAVRPKTIFHKGIELFIDIFIKFDFKLAGYKLFKKIGLSNAKSL